MYSPGGGSIYGPAITVKMVETNSPGPTPAIHFADANKEGHIMYISQPKGMYSACWGGLMSTRAQKLGSLGTMIDGRMRDTREHVEMGYPVSFVLALIEMILCFVIRVSFWQGVLLITERAGLCSRYGGSWIKYFYSCLGD